MNDSVSELQERMTVATQSSLFLTQALPMQIHLQLCEGLNKIATASKQKDLLEFENAKLKEIDDYITRLGGETIVGPLTTRMKALRKHFVELEQGVPRFIFDVDIRKGMTNSELNFIGRLSQQEMKKRMDDFFV